MNLIKFLNDDADGCGTSVECIVKVNTDLTNGDKKRLQNIVDNLKNEDEDWDFDEIVEEACRKYFKPNRIKYDFIGIAMTINL